MSTYVISDIHGQYKAYKKMLREIDFKPEDTLYVLGDAIDRGPNGIKVLMDLMKRKNVEFFVGNHELLMLDALVNMQENRSKQRSDTDDVDLWLDPCNGGKSTYDAYIDLPVSKRKELIQYIQNAWVVKKLTIGKKKFHLSHAYTSDKRMGDGLKYADMTHSQIWDIVWVNIYDRAFICKNAAHLFPNKKTIYVSGHTFTQRLDCVDEKGRGIIYHNKDYHGYQVYNIDCGMALKNKTSQLACLRLEDEAQFYVPLEE